VRPILKEAELPPINASSERPDLDFKVSMMPTPSIEHAKDVAALGNTIGGTIIVGAATGGMVVSSYPGIPRNIAEKLTELTSKASRIVVGQRPAWRRRPSS
jgi:hypothetical protein